MSEEKKAPFNLDKENYICEKDFKINLDTINDLAVYEHTGVHEEHQNKALSRLLSTFPTIDGLVDHVAECPPCAAHYGIAYACVTQALSEKMKPERKG